MSNITEKIEKLNFYGWTKKGMTENPDVPIEDVFILRSEVLALQNKVSDVSDEEESETILCMPKGISSEWFAEQRKKSGFTLRQVEEGTGISNPYLSQLENGKIKNPSFSVVQKLNDFYNVKNKVGAKEDWQDLAYKELPITIQDSSVKQFLLWLKSKNYSIIRVNEIKVSSISTEGMMSEMQKSWVSAGLNPEDYTAACGDAMKKYASIVNERKGDIEMPDIEKLIENFLPNQFDLESFKPKEFLFLKSAFRQGATVMFHELKNGSQNERKDTTGSENDKLVNEVGLEMMAILSKVLHALQHSNMKGTILHKEISDVLKKAMNTPFKVSKNPPKEIE